MQFAKLLFIGSTFVVASLAQAKIAFTTLPASVRAGEPITLKWAGGDNSPVTLTLKQGDPDNLQTVAIITGKATGTSYTWTPSKSLPSADNYALQISQGPEDVNYSGEFTLTGGSAAVATTSLSSSSSATITSAASLSSSLSSSIASLNSSVSALVASVTNSTNVTTTAFVPAGTGAVGSGASGASAVTGTALHRNTTMSHATLSSTKKPTSTASSTSSESSAAGTSSAPSSTSSSDAMRMASPLALVMGAFAAIVYLG